MISKITAILAAAVVLAFCGCVLWARPCMRHTPTPTTTRIREICASGTQTTRSLTPMPGRCGRTLCAVLNSARTAVVRFSLQYQGWQRRPARCCNPAKPGAPTGPSRLARADAPATMCAETLTMRSLAWFVMSPPRWVPRRSCLALLASRRRRAPTASGGRRRVDLSAGRGAVLLSAQLALRTTAP